jgi:hypothetical protein
MNIEVEIDFSKYPVRCTNKSIALSEASKLVPDNYCMLADSVKFFMKGIKRYARVTVIKEKNNVFIT